MAWHTRAIAYMLLRVNTTERCIIVKFGDSILVNVYMTCVSVPHHTDVHCDTHASISAYVRIFLLWRLKL